jgi:CRISPR-associated protein Csd2
MAIENTYNFVMLFDVTNGNPNGDPDAGNAPRIDPETNFGIITDVCLKRKIRNYVQLAKNNTPGYNILIQPDQSLNAKFTGMYQSNGLPTGKKGKEKDVVKAARDFMCKNYFDVRTFGAVMSTGDDPCAVRYRSTLQQAARPS